MMTRVMTIIPTRKQRRWRLPPQLTASKSHRGLLYVLIMLLMTKMTIMMMTAMMMMMVLLVSYMPPVLKSSFDYDNSGEGDHLTKDVTTIITIKRQYVHQ